jgi:hypothetical protein
MEVLAAEARAGTVIEVSESRFDAAEIRTLYESPEYSEAQETKALNQGIWGQALG